MLVTTPFHLRTLLGDVEALPTLDLIVCATAPLSPQLAREAEQRSGAPLLEIYGCTETGQLATRRATQTGEWEPLPEVRIDTRDGRTWASGGHVEQAMPLADIIETVADGRFVLHGRSADVVNLAGKRTSLAYLGHQLNSIEGLKGVAVTNPGSIGAAGLTLAVQILDGKKPAQQTVLVDPALWTNATPEGKAQLEAAADPSLSPEWPVSISIEGWTSYTKEQIIACKGPGE